MLRLAGPKPPAPAGLPGPPPGGPSLGPPPGLPSGPPPMPSSPGGPPPGMPPQAAGGPDESDPTASGAAPEDAGKTSQHLVVYRGPDEGPFACGNCSHFDGQGSCDVVQGKIDPGGVCNIFESAGPAGQDDGSGDAGPDSPLPPGIPPPING